MRRLEVVSVLFVVALALLPATAFALPTLLPAGTVSFEGSNTTGAALATAGEEIQCSSYFIEASKNKIETGVEGPFHLMYSSCTTAGGLVTCTGLGELNARILLLGTMHIVYDTLSPLGAAFLYSVNQNHAECAGNLFVISGTVLCLVKPTNEKTKGFTLKCEGEKGKPKETHYWNDEGKEVQTQLLTSKNEIAGEATSLSTELSFTTSRELEIMA